MINLPEWKLTLCPPLYDTSSKSPIYAKMRELVEAFNTFAQDLSEQLSNHTVGSIQGMHTFKADINRIMSEYITSIDCKVSIIEELFRNYEKDVEERLMRIVEEKFNDGSITIKEVFDENTESMHFVLGGVDNE